MHNKNAHLSENLFTDTIEKAATRDGFGTGSIEAGRLDENVVVLCADLSESTRAEMFQKEFPDRFIEMGVAEQNMATVAAGMAVTGKVPFITSYAVFNPGRNYEQIRTTIALNQANVKVCGMHAGISVGPDGASHQMLEDIGLMRMLPGMVVINPGDAEEARKTVVAAAKYVGPVYIRFSRSVSPTFTTSETSFVLGKALTLWESEKPDVAILSTGTLSYAALEAAHLLQKEGVETLVVHIPTIKPLDTEAIISAAKQAGAVLTIEEHQVAGGFGSAVAEVLSEQYPVPMRFAGIRDRFGQSGTPEELLTEYGLDVPHIVEAVHVLHNHKATLPVFEI